MKKHISMLLCMIFLFGTALASESEIVYLDLSEAMYTFVIDLMSNDFYKNSKDIVGGGIGYIGHSGEIACKTAAALKKYLPDWNFSIDKLEYPAMVGYNTSSEDYVAILLDSGNGYYWLCMYFTQHRKLVFVENKVALYEEAPSIMERLCDKYYKINKAGIRLTYDAYYK